MDETLDPAPTGPLSSGSPTGGVVRPLTETPVHVRLLEMEASNRADGSTPDRPSAPEEAFGALGDPARLALLRELQRGTRCVCDLSPKLGMAANLVSYHVGKLREAGLVERSRRGRRVEYRVRPMALQALAVELVRLAVGADEREA
jgi:ArsR family transcriptional regulator